MAASGIILIIIAVVFSVLAAIIAKVISAHKKKNNAFLIKYLGNKSERVKTYRGIPAALIAVLTALIAVWGVVYNVEKNIDNAVINANNEYRRTLQDRFSHATEQLESSSAYTRVSAINTIAILADEWQQRTDLDPNGTERSLCIEAICAYLKKPIPQEDEENEIIVRTAISRQLSAHLSNDALLSWSDYSFDFSWSVFYNLDLSASLLRSPNFSNSIFLGGASFRETMFEGVALFSGATFEGEALFWNATFEGDASFVSASFEDGANFRIAKFEGEADFWTATFEGWASFRSVTFEDGAYFVEVTFEGWASFDSATFEGLASFGFAKFEGQADFGSATFENETRFGSTKFLSDINFEYSVLNGIILFDSAEFTVGTMVLFPEGYLLLENGLPDGALWVDPPDPIL